MGAKSFSSDVDLHKALEQYRRELLSRLARGKAESRVAEKLPADFADLCTQTIGREDIFSQLDASQYLLTLVEEALFRIQQGTFGRCLECHQAISLARLRAIPWADCCISCQEQRERHRAA